MIKPSVILVTGPMASGKNYISSKMESDGWKSIDADILVHKVINEQAIKIYDTFKTPAREKNIDILLRGDEKNPVINRKALGSLLFSDPLLLKKQEDIIYPEVIKLTKEFIRSNEKTIINATVLYKTPELLNMCSKIIYVKSSFLKRLLRAKRRDKLPLKQILQRFYSQRHLFTEYSRFSIPIETINN